jgi:hypothetical protein
MRNRYAIALAVLSAAATGSAIQILYAQGTPPAYVVAEINVSNQDAYAKEFVPPEVKSITDGAAAGFLLLIQSGERPGCVEPELAGVLARRTKDRRAIDLLEYWVTISQMDGWRLPS